MRNAVGGLREILSFGIEEAAAGAGPRAAAIEQLPSVATAGPSRPVPSTLLGCAVNFDSEEAGIGLRLRCVGDVGSETTEETALASSVVTPVRREMRFSSGGLDEDDDPSLEATTAASEVGDTGVAAASSPSCFVEPIFACGNKTSGTTIKHGRGREEVATRNTGNRTIGSLDTDCSVGRK